MHLGCASMQANLQNSPAGFPHEYVLHSFGSHVVHTEFSAQSMVLHESSTEIFKI